MKKTIAGILIVSLLIGVSACKKQTEKTSETEITVSSEVTSSETETSSSETSETTETETDVPDTSETSPTTEAVLRQPEPAETIEIKHDLKFLDVETPVVEHRYGALNPAGSRVHQVTTTAESLVIKSDGYEELKKEIGKIFDEKAAFFEDLYNEMLPMFLSDLEQRKEKPSELIANNYVRVYRADNKIVSFSDNCGWWKENSDGEQNGDSSDIYYNFFSETGKRVSLDDVVADKTGFCECIRYICKQKDYNQEKAEEICTAVMDGSIEFCLTLDGIVLQKEYLSFSAFNYPGIFHMECFQSVPKNYMLESDSSEMISWDLNDDGKTDSIYLSFSDDVISIGGVENKLERDQGYDFPDEGYSFYLAHVPDGFLLLTGGYCGSEDSYEIIFRIKDDFTVEYFDSGMIFSDQYYDPMDMKLMSVDDVYNLGYFQEREYVSTFTLTGKRTVESKDVQSFDRKGSPMVTLKDIKCRILEGKDTWKDYTLPKGSAVSRVGYDPKKQELILETLHPDEKDNRTVRVFYDGDNGTVNPFELFSGMSYGG